MGLFKLFIPKADPAVAWKTEAGLVTDFEFDFDRHSLCGIALGDPAALLWKLGPSDNEDAAEQGTFNYYSKGVQIEVEDGLVRSFALFWNDTLHRLFLPFTGTCHYRGRAVHLHAGTGETEIQGLFGEPYRRDQDENEIILFHEFGKVEWQLEMDLHGGLTAILIITPPLLANPEQRKAYKVAKPWPPPPKP